jgi:hypothetical protein
LPGCSEALRPAILDASPLVHESPETFFLIGRRSK